MNSKYTVVKDGGGWGVEFDGALVNDAPISKADAQKLAAECNRPANNHFADENPNWE